MKLSANTTISRSPKIAWQNGFERYWCQGSPAVTHAFNAFSFLLPRGETFFIQVAVDAAKSIDLESLPGLKTQLSAFILQEARHSHQHRQYNLVLQRQGFKNVIEEYIVRYQRYSRQHFSKLTNLALVCAYEHYTAIIGDFVLNTPALLPDSQPELALLWGWHCVEEISHQTVCIDLYHILGGGWLRRIFVFLLASLNLALMFSIPYIYLLLRDGCLRVSSLLETSSDCAKFFFGSRGILWHLIANGARYFNPKFYPSVRTNQTRLQEWLANNQDRLTMAAKAPQ
jgi:predicted metal-dependent hydrolase